MNIKTSTNLYLFWNFGSILMFNMSFQIFLGLMLSMNYFSKSMNFFINSFYIYYDINFGWMIRFFHSNLTSMIFIILIIHLIRNLIFKNYINLLMWVSGLLMFLLIMIISFIGYSLLWSQMSFWASMVITNFISSIPKIGKMIILWIWGNFFIMNILMNRFFSLHFLFPLILLMISFFHMIILHKNLSTNPLSLNNKMDMINLSPLFLIKDFFLLLMIFYLFFLLNFFKPLLFNNFDNFMFINYFKTPNHIEPEWYFLFFYAILRSVQNKLTGLLILILSIKMIFLIPFFNKIKFLSINFFLIKKIFMMLFIMIILIISILGAKLLEYPYIFINKIFIFIYFFLFMIFFFISKLINNLN